MHCGEAGAISERTITNAGYAIRNCYAGETSATIERPLANAGYAIGDNSILATYNKCICCSFNNGIATLAAIINTIITINSNVCEAGATIERTLANAGYAIANGYAGEAGAINERIIAYAGYAIGDFNAGEACAIIERIIAYAGYAIANGYAGEAVATLERIIAYAGYAIGDYNAGEAGAILERIIAYAGYAIGDNSILATCNKCICCSFNNCIATLAAIINTITTINGNAC